MSFAAVLERLQKLENPYPGLRPFETHEPHLFFGRDQQIAELVARLERNRFLAVLGVSGSGKSSLVRAGLVPALQRGNVGEAGSHWRMVITRPAGTPFQTLSTSLSESGLDASTLRQSSYGLSQVARQLPREETLLVVVDQFEELFRYKEREQVTEEAQRERAAAAVEASEFVQLLLAASSQQPPVYVVLTMRSDYLGDCAEFRDLPETLNNCQYLIPRLTREQRKQAIEGPLGHTAIAPNLVQRILNDAGDEPDQLPILQHALMRTWSRWRRSDPEQNRRIELQDYEAIGGFENALNQHADELLEGVPMEIAATIFKRLTAQGRGDRERRDPATLSELWAVCGAITSQQQSQVNFVIDHFRHGEATFLTPRDGRLLFETFIDITHESLIRLWKKLRDEWLPEESKSAKTFLYLLGRAKSWKTGKGEALLGLDLTEAVEWNRQRNLTTAWAIHYADASDMGTVLEFIKASGAQEQKRRVQKRMFAITLPLTLLFAVLAGVAVYQSIKAKVARHVAEDQRAIAQARQLINQSTLLLTQNSLEPAALFATEGMQRLPGFDADHAMRATQESLKLLAHQVLRFDHHGPVYASAFRPDGHYIVTASSDKMARVWNATTGQLLATLQGHTGSVSSAAFSPDGQRILTVSIEGRTARLWNATTGQALAILQGHTDSVSSAAFSPDGQSIVTASADHTARVWNAKAANY